MRRLLIVLLVGGVLCWIFHAPILRALGHFLVRDDGPAPADAVVILAGGSGGDRVLKGGELVRGGFAPVALMIGPPMTYGKNECELAIPFAVQHGYPESYFVCIPFNAESTRQEARFVVAELKRRAIKKFLLVTSDFHTARAGRVFAAEVSQSKDLAFRVVPSRAAEFDIEHWWASRAGLKFIYMEWSKTAIYLVSDQ